MFRASLLFLNLFLFCGCNNVIVRSELGIGTTGPIGRSLQPAGKNISGLHTGFKFGPEIYLPFGFRTDILMGPTIIHRFGEDSKAIGFDFSPRIRYVGWPIEPYLMPLVGVTYLTDRWEPQPTDWGFTIGVGVGARKRVADTWVFLEYRFFHESNGSKIFGSPTPNPGFNMSMLMVGIEWNW